MNLSEWKKRGRELELQYNSAASAFTQEKKELAKSIAREKNAEEARDILQQTGQTVQQQVHDKIANVVSRCLSAVFGKDAYEFKIIFERKRNRTEAKLEFWKDRQEVHPTMGSGGGALDVAAFALRVACLMMTKPPLRRLLILDEPMKFVSKDYRPKVATLIEALAEELGIQFLLVTHDQEFQIGKIIEIK